MHRAEVGRRKDFYLSLEENTIFWREAIMYTVFVEEKPMISVRGIYDGQMIKLLEPLPVAEPMKVIVTFLEDESGEEADMSDPRISLRQSLKGTFAGQTFPVEDLEWQ